MELYILLCLKHIRKKRKPLKLRNLLTEYRISSISELVGRTVKQIKMEKFKNKYRITSARASWLDYGWNGAYFITICTKKRRHYFGEIVDGEMVLSEIGHFANSCWDEIPTHFPFVNWVILWLCLIIFME